MNNEGNVNFHQITYCVKKNIETEAVFTKREMNNEGNVNFHQITYCVQKASKLKLYLPREKRTMKETLIFIKLRAVFKKYRN